MRSAGLVILGASMLIAPFTRAQTGTDTAKPPAPGPSAAEPAPSAPATTPPSAETRPAEPSTPEPEPAAQPPAEPSSAASGSAKTGQGDGINQFVVVDDRDPEPPLIPNAADRLAGHFSLAAGAGFAFPFGKLESGVGANDVIAPGWMFSLNAGIGVSRSVVIGAWGQYLLYGDGDDCEGCDATSFAVGPFVRYHLVQGMRFDPWLLAGIGYRKMTVSTDTVDLDYSGVEWLHLEFGGDWYPTSVLGLGPYLGFDWGIYGDHPGDRGSSSHFQITTGLRINLDVPGK